MSIPQNIKNLANSVRNAIYGKDVRESIAKSMEATGDTADVAKKTSEEQIERVDRIIANAGKDNTEIVDARGGEKLLGNRLNSIDQNMAQMASLSYVDAILASLGNGAPKEAFFSLP
ncbi:hypothetical protein CWR48_04335, partial [Oceanobacillus arenosus]